jgi:hypothetical protein
MFFKPNVQKLKQNHKIDKLLYLTGAKTESRLRKEALIALGELNDFRVLPNLILASFDENLDIRQTAFLILIDFIEKLKVLNDFKKLFDLTSPRINIDIRKKALSALAEIKNDQVLKVFIDSMETENEEIKTIIKSSVIKFLLNSKEVLSIKQLISLTDYRKFEADIRIEALKALAIKGGNNGLLQIVHCLEDYDNDVEEKAKELLSKVEPNILSEFIEPILKEHRFVSGVIEELIILGATFEPKIVSILPNDNSPLCFAVRNGCLEIVKILLKNGADPNKEGKYFYLGGEISLPLIILSKPFIATDVNPSQERRVSRNRKGIAEILIQYGATLTSIPKSYVTYPLFNALRNFTDLGNGLKYIWATSAQNHHLDSKSLIASAQFGYTLEGYCSKEDKIKWIEHVKLATKGTIDFIEVLLNNGVDINVIVDDYSALYFAIDIANPFFVNYLLQKGANPNISSKDHNPLRKIIGGLVTNDNVIVKLLIDNGADLNKPCYGKLKPLEMAREYGREDLVRIFKKAMKS